MENPIAPPSYKKVSLCTFFKINSVKMKLSITFGLLCVFISEVAALTCNDCVHDTHGYLYCYNKTCPESDGHCASKTLVGPYKVHLQMCASSHDCISGSINLGLSNYTVNTECCEGDHCNHQIVPELIRNNTPNGMECFTCEGGDCNKNLSCLGDEDVCITSLRNSETVKGCASLDLCLSARRMTYDLSWTSCCKGNLCNSESRHPYNYHGMYPSTPPSDVNQHGHDSDSHSHSTHSDGHGHSPTHDHSTHSDYHHDPHSDGHYDPHYDDHYYDGDHYYDDDPCEGIFCSSSKTVGQSVLLLLGSLLYLLLVQ
ncbi:uncharacterized protein LOC134059970 [Sardina pilchardus]|uniref:uncharacterized protein LOC134059970 n=1 Tax=Sardina pilchardus TaxID=27697 RepID=UPI002E116637